MGSLAYVQIHPELQQSHTGRARPLESTHRPGTRKTERERCPDDWDRINNDWHVPSLIRTTRSHGWRPDLIGRLKVDWYDRDDNAIYIPEGEAPKNDAYWRADLTDEGALALDNWLEQRKLMDLYDGQDEIWLNRKGNPYSSGSLCRLVRKLCDEAEVPYEDRPVRWYSLRHSIDQHMESDGSLNQTNDQLRHNTYETTVSTYGNSAAEERRETLNKYSSHLPDGT